MMKKTIASNSDSKPIVLGEKTESSSDNITEPVSSSICNEDFNVGSIFLNDSKIWRVTEARYDSNTHMRRISSNVGDDSVLTLKALRSYINLKSFKFMPDDNLSESFRKSDEKNKK